MLENGKALPDALGEITYAAEFFRWYAEEAVRNTGEISTAPAGTNRILVLRQPIGVAALGDPVELPGGHADPEDRPGTGGRLHRRLQTGIRDTAHCAGRRPDPRGGRLPGRGRERRSLQPFVRLRRRTPCRSPCPQAVLHRLDRGGAGAAADRSRQRGELLHGTRRERPVPGVRRCRPRRRRRWRHGRQDAQRRRGVHLGEPLLRPAWDRRRRSPSAWPRRCRRLVVGPGLGDGVQTRTARQRAES